MTDKRMANEIITIVSGLPRSGTSMMMRMIEQGGIPALVDHERKPDEDNPRGYYEFEPVKKTRQDPSWLERAPGKVVKMVHLLLLELPTDREYRVVFMRRDLDEVIRSQNVMLERKGKPSSDLNPEQIKGLFNQQLQQVDGYLKEHRNFKVLYVNYNELIRDPQPAVEAVNVFLGDQLDAQAMLAVVDPNLYRQRKS